MRLLSFSVRLDHEHDVVFVSCLRDTKSTPDIYRPACPDEPAICARLGSWMFVTTSRASYFQSDQKEMCLMTLRRIQLSAFAIVLFACFLASSVAQPITKNSSAVPAANWTFSGCWTQFSSQPCRDIFVDEQGNHWICKACGSTGKPGPGKCNPISQATLASGLWCS